MSEAGGEGDRSPAGVAAGLIRRFLGGALTAVLVGCSAAPSMTPSPAASVVSTEAPSAQPSPSAPSPIPSPTAPPLSPPPTAPPDPAYSGSFGVLPAPAPAGFQARIACTGRIGADDPVAIVRMHGGGDDELVLRDYADVAHPRTACTFAGAWIRQLIDPRHVVVTDNDAEFAGLFAVVELPAVRYAWFQLPRSQAEWGPELITVGPALDRIVWKDVHAEDTDTDILYLSTANRTRVLRTVVDTNSGRCGQGTDSIQGRFTISGSYFNVLNQPVIGDESLLVYKGHDEQLSILPPNGHWASGRQPIMAVWSPVTPTLYWSQDGDVWRWTPDAGKQVFIAGVTWFDPTISADGRYLAYATPRADGKDVTYLVDLEGDAVPHRIGDGPRGSPRFVNATQLWWRVQSAGHGCTGPQPGPAIYNVATGSEDGSVVDDVIATWPATKAGAW